MGILEKIAEIEKEISRTQKNKGKKPKVVCPHPRTVLLNTARDSKGPQGTALNDMSDATRQGTAKGCTYDVK